VNSLLTVVKNHCINTSSRVIYVVVSFHNTD